MFFVLSLLFSAHVHAQSQSIPAPRLQVLGASNFNFTFQPVNATPAKHTFIFENVGILPITQIQVIPMVAPFKVEDLENPTMTTCDATLPVGGRCTITVDYQPSDNTPAAATLLLSYFDGTSSLAAFATISSGQ